MNTKDPARMVGVFAVVLGLWGVVFWLWGPAAPPISFGDRPEGFVEPRPLTQVQREPGTGAPGSATPVSRGGGGGAGGSPEVRRVLEKPQFRSYTVRKGDTSFEVIAARPEVFGDRRLASAIRDSNPLVSPDRLIPGRTVLRIPVDPTNTEGRIVTVLVPQPPRAEPRPGPSPAPTPRPEAATPKPPVNPAPLPAPAKGTEYVVAKGDTLSGIAKKHYGKSALWTIIVEANRNLLDDPSDLKIGMRLTLPPRPAE
ncbi:MAG: LysM peptidoglycan-binding domain-containing protein [Phycisphaerae bacterium]|nr:LysM peptidoglycan-binding domain-containing protein [Phycisphaerae bacterium]